jgi:maltooligosyltrehalose trehalohydrolase
VTQKAWALDIGAMPVNREETKFRVWAPLVNSVAVRMIEGDRRTVPLHPHGKGYFEAVVKGVGPGESYIFVLDDMRERPDPASRLQPEGVHGPSVVVDPGRFQWTDEAWLGMRLHDMIIYELHVGTFTREGTFEAVIPWLSYLKDTVGITAIELMPVAQFPGRRNWGYDGVYPFAPQASYGGPEGLKRLVDACHAAGMAVILDVVYNHLGPEGNYLAEYGPYFTDRYLTPWGSALNYDGPDSDEVRHYFVSNALYWVTEYHFDGLRLDAVHGIYDFGAQHILKEIASVVRVQAEQLNRHIVIIAESDLNDTRIIDPCSEGGYGLDAQWNDDFHHALHVTLTNEQNGYYQDFNGLKDLATAVSEGFVYQGQHSSYRRRRHGSCSQHCLPSQFVVFSQNHDQVGNRATGDRLSPRLSIDALKVARALVLLSPAIPLLFMGEEYGETAPFQYFIEHGDPALIDAVRRGRQQEFAHFGWKAEEIPDPQDPSTFERCRLDPNKLDTGQTQLLHWTHALIRLRKSVRTLASGAVHTLRHSIGVFEEEQVLVLHRWSSTRDGSLVILGFNRTPVTLVLTVPTGAWKLVLDSGTAEFGGVQSSPMPHEVVINSAGATLKIPSYTAAIYASSERQHD